MNEPLLLVEDEEDDVLFMQIALKRAGVTNRLQLVPDGRETIAYLNGDRQYCPRQDYPLPGLVLLDLRLPQVPDLDVLKWIRQRPAFHHLHVIVCSSSCQTSDVETAHRLGASAYVIKPPPGGTSGPRASDQALLA